MRQLHRGVLAGTPDAVLGGPVAADGDARYRLGVAGEVLAAG